MLPPLLGELPNDLLDRSRAQVEMNVQLPLLQISLPDEQIHIMNDLDSDMQ